MLNIWMHAWMPINSHFFFSFLLIVLAMESQAEALGQLTTDDLEGKVRDHDLGYPFHI